MPHGENLQTGGEAKRLSHKDKGQNPPFAENAQDGAPVKAKGKAVSSLPARHDGQAVGGPPRSVIKDDFTTGTG